MTKDPAAAAATYFDAWKARDFARLRSVLADDVDFVGPLGKARGVEECLRGLRGMAQIMTGLEVRADPVPVANWMHVEDGKITRIRVTFDARGFSGG
jgi:ketosteroid isomerase-like protein